MVRQPILEFLLKEWKDGRLVGPKAQDAFFVRCDRTTMSQEDIDNGTLVIEVGVALIRPAEFVILRIAHQMERVGPRNLVDKALDGTKRKKHYYMARTIEGVIVHELQKISTESNSGIDHPAYTIEIDDVDVMQRDLGVHNFVVFSKP